MSTTPNFTLSSSFSITPASAMQTSVIQTTFTSPSEPTGTHGSGHGGSGNNSSSNDNTGTSITNSAALYLYTFLATLVLLLSLTTGIVIRSFILRRRHRRMVEEAIRNGTWVPPSARSRALRVDLSKKPVLSDAYIDKKGSIYYSHGGTARGKSINLDWDMIKPISAAYLASSTAPGPTSSIAPVPVSSATRIPPIPVPVPTPAGDPPSHPSSSSSPTPRHHTIFSQAMRMLSPTSLTPGPANPSSDNINASGNETGDAYISMVGLGQKGQSPSLIIVAVLIAMPSPPTSSLSRSLSPAAPLSTSLFTNASSSSSSSPPPPTQLTSPASTSPPPKVTRSAFSLPLPPATDEEEEHRIPHIEVGVAEVLVVPPDSVTQDEGTRLKSIASRDSVASEV